MPEKPSRFSYLFLLWEIEVHQQRDLPRNVPLDNPVLRSESPSGSVSHRGSILMALFFPKEVLLLRKT